MLSAEENALFSTVDSDDPFADPVPVTAAAPAAVLPPDAPANSASVPAPEKAKKKKTKSVLVDESTVPDEVLKAQQSSTVPTAVEPLVQTTVNTIYVELGPETLAILKALLSK